LFSGGLDSTLAIKVIKEQGIEVIALNFMSPFCRCDRSNGCVSAIVAMSEKLGVSFKRMYLGDEYLEIVRKPKYGYGRNINPCIDCRILKFKLGKQYMEETGASFLISGEVLGQRPMSQHRQALQLIDKEAGIEGIILRPLSAKLFEPTLPEREGWVDRDKLLGIAGRGRRPQMQLAEHYGITDYPCPAGGCLLTDPGFSRRFKDALQENDLSLKDIEAIKIGRYFKIGESFRLLVGRNEKENNKLMALAGDDYIIFEPCELPGPTAIGKLPCDEATQRRCAQIIAWYTDREKTVTVRITNKRNGSERMIQAAALAEAEVKRMRI